MKASIIITGLALFVLSSCSSSLYTGAEYDDLYFLPSDRSVAAVQKPVKGNKVAEKNLTEGELYDNVYASDTLVSDEYANALNSNTEYSQSSDYYTGYDDYSYSGRLRRFYGNSFYPYWRDPFYFNWGSPYYGFSSFYDPFYYDPFYYDYGYYGPYSFYSPYYYSPYYYSPYSYWGYGGYSYGGMGGWYSSIRYNDGNGSVEYSHRERQSSLSSNYNRTMYSTASTRRDNYVSKDANTDAAKRSVAGSSSLLPADSRRSAATASGARQVTDYSSSKSGQSLQGSGNTSAVRSAATTSRQAATTRPEYNNAGSTYSPSYSNQRMSSRPSYNTTRVNTGAGTVNSSVSNSSGSTRPGSSVSSSQTRSSNSYTSPSSTYSAPSRRSVESGSGYSSGSFSNSRSSSSSYSNSSYSSGSRSSSGSSYSSGSSGGGSYSGGSSSSSGGGGNASGGGGGSTSSGRR